MALSEHLEKLRYFVKLAAFNSFQSASRSMGISQAALSKSIKNLESVLNVSLFIRSNEGLTLTESGRILLDSSKRILDESLMAEAKLTSHRSSSPKTVRLGVYDSIAVYFYTDLARYLAVSYPKLQFQITVVDSRSLQKLMEAGQLDLMIGVNLAAGNEEYIHVAQLWEDEYGFFVNPSLNKMTSRTPVLFHPHVRITELLDCEAFLNLLIKSRPVLKVLNFETLKTLTLLSHGCGVLPLKVAKPFVVEGNLKQIFPKDFAQAFGKHSISLAVGSSFKTQNSVFFEDLYRLSCAWAK